MSTVGVVWSLCLIGLDQLWRRSSLRSVETFACCSMMMGAPERSVYGLRYYLCTVIDNVKRSIWRLLHKGESLCCFRDSASVTYGGMLPSDLTLSALRFILSAKSRQYCLQDCETVDFCNSLIYVEYICLTGHRGILSSACHIRHPMNCDHHLAGCHVKMERES